MKILTARLKGVSPYSQSRYYVKTLEQGESQDDAYKRTWRQHMHTDKDGIVFIPPTGVKNCVSEAAKFLSISVPGKGKSTYTKHFEAGLMVAKPATLGIRASDVDFEALFLPSDGKRGGGKRVLKYYPVLPSWEADVELVVLDETILQTSVVDKSRTVLDIVLEAAGQFIGLGRFRPRNNGFYGRFDVVNIK